MSSDLTAVVFPGRTGNTAGVTDVASTPATRSIAVDASILLAAAAGIAHGISTPTHWRWWQASGVFFGALTVAQLALALALYLNHTGVKTVLAGIWSNVLVVSVYVASRLAALPGQPAITAHHSPKAPGRAFLPAQPEGVGAFDMFALIVELVLIVLLVGMLPTKARSRTTTALMCCGLAFCAFAAWTVMSNCTIG